jgi:tetratricopeptide (TPR) repeat protein
MTSSQRVATRGIVPAICAGLALAVAVVYAPVPGFEFIYCDDDAYVFENSTVRQGLSRVGVAWAVSGAHVANWHPVTWLSHMLDVELFGLDAGGHHAVNVAFHAANAALLFLALRALTGTLWPAAVVAALFALHPLRVESVAWVAERKDVLSGFFFMATLLAYAAYARRPGVVRYAWVFAGVALGLAAKSMLVTLPCVLLLLDVWPLRRWRRETALRLVAEKLPLLALAAAASAAAIWSQSSDGAMGDLATLPFSARLSNAVDAYAAYLGKTVWPTRLAIFYPHPALASPESYTALRVGTVAAAIGLIAATGLALQQLRGRPYLAVGWFWTLGMLVPVIGLVQVGEQAMADRYAYLSLIGVSIVIVWGVRDLATALPPLRLALVVIVPVVLVACTALTSRQVLHWRDGQSVFEHALTVTERNYFAHNHLGRTFENRGEVELAARQYEAAIAIRPSAGTLSNLGAALAKLGRHEDAVARFEDALRLEPDSASAHSNLGVVYGMFDQPQKAIAAYERALELGSQKPAPYYNLGSLLVRLGEFERGARHLEQALALDPYHAGAANNLGVAYTELGTPAPTAPSGAATRPPEDRPRPARSTRRHCAATPAACTVTASRAISAPARGTSTRPWCTSRRCCATRLPPRRHITTRAPYTPARATSSELASTSTPRCASTRDTPSPAKTWSSSKQTSSRNRPVHKGPIAVTGFKSSCQSDGAQKQRQRSKERQSD